MSVDEQKIKHADGSKVSIDNFGPKLTGAEFTDGLAKKHLVFGYEDTPQRQ